MYGAARGARSNFRVHCTFIMAHGIQRITFFQTWTHTFIAPAPFGRVDLDIFRYNPKGTRMLIIGQVIQVLRCREAGFRELLADSKPAIRIFKEKDGAVIARLVQVGALQIQRPGDKPDNFETVRLSDIIKLMKGVGAWNVLLPAFGEAMRSQPTPSANNMGTSKLDELAEAAASADELLEQPSPAASALRRPIEPPWRTAGGLPQGVPSPPIGRRASTSATDDIGEKQEELTPSIMWAAGVLLQPRYINTGVGR